MAPHIVFASTYPPVVCGIGSYLSYVMRELTPGQASVVAFDPQRYGGRVAVTADEPECGPAPSRVRYLLERPDTDPRMLMAGTAAASPAPPEETVLWFQHAPDIWPHFPSLLRALAELPVFKVASMHVVHFQSGETAAGLRAREHALLAEVLPLLDLVTCFTPSAAAAVQQAFPQYADRVAVLRHGLHTPQPLDQREARRVVAGFLEQMPDAVRPHGAAGELARALNDPETAFVGTMGFIQADKGFEAAFRLRDELQVRLPERRVVGLVMGSMREPDLHANRRLMRHLGAAADGEGRFMVEALPPDAVFQAALAAMDINVYWPDSPTQSGRVAHALGVGATVLGRDIEGLGDTLREVGVPAAADFDELVPLAAGLLTHPELAQGLRERGRSYARRYSWAAQARRHLSLADGLVERRRLRIPELAG